MFIENYSGENDKNNSVNEKYVKGRIYHLVAGAYQDWT